MQFGMKAHEKWNSVIFLLITMTTLVINASNLEMSPHSPICNYVCRCDYEKLSVNCTDSNLNAVPGAIPRNSKILSLTNNKIRIIKTKDFSGLNEVKKLILASNQIMAIEQGAFKDMYGLQYLNLNDNKLLSIPSGIFQHLPSLEIIELRRNSIGVINGKAFLFLPNLKEILMGMNPIKCDCVNQDFVNYLKSKMSHVNFEGICEKWQVPFTDMLFGECIGFKEIFRDAMNCSICIHDNCHTKLCDGYEPVCMNRVTMVGFTLRSKKSCSTYAACMRAELDNVAKCKDWDNGTSCVSCCIEELCNTHDFAGWTHTFDLQLKLMMDEDEMRPSHDENLFGIWKRRFKEKVEKELLDQNGTFTVVVHEFRLPAVTVISKIICTVPIHIDELQVWQNILNILKTSKNLKTLPIIPNTISLTGKMLCMGETTKDDKGEFHWPTAKVGTSVQLPCLTNNQVTTRKCENITTLQPTVDSGEEDDLPNNYEGKRIQEDRETDDIRGRAKREESDESTEEPVVSDVTVWAKPNSQKCREDWITRELEDLDLEDMDDDSIERQSARLLNLSQNAEFFKKIDVELSVKILERILPHISNLTTKLTTGNVLPILNNMMDTPEKSLIQAEEAKLSANKLLEMADSISENMQLEESELSVSYSNLDVGIVRATHKRFQGATFVMNKNKTNGMSNTMTVLPKKLSFKESDELSISLPETLFDNLKETVDFHISRITFVLFKQDKLFKVIGEAAKRSKTTKSDPSTKRKTDRFLQRINSQVLAATVPGVHLTDLKDPVTMRFRHLSQNATNPRCVFWQDSLLTIAHWSTEGCSVRYTIPGKLTVCECMHLTSFALLMDIYNSGGPVDPRHSKALSMLSFIGCGISFFALLITISTYLGFRKLRSGAVSHILVSLCITLAASNLIFVVGMQPYTLNEIVACKIVAVLLHYTLLASMMWMAIEAIHIYLALVVVFRTYLSHFIIRCSLFAWGLPLGIVALTLGINNTENYVLKGKICWLSQSAFYASFLFPISVVLLFNVSIFCIIVWRLLAMQKIKKYEHNRKKIRLIGIVGVFFLLGLTWTMAFLAVGEAGLIFNYLFTIFNSFQGLFIFVFYCLYKKESRENLIQLFQCLQRSEKSEKFNSKLSPEGKPSKKSKDIRSRKSYNSESNVNSTENSNAAFTDDNNVITKL